MPAYTVASQTLMRRGLEVQVGGEDKDPVAPGVAVQARPFSPPPGTAAPIPTFSPQVGLSSPKTVHRTAFSHLQSCSQGLHLRCIHCQKDQNLAVFWPREVHVNQDEADRPASPREHISEMVIFGHLDGEAKHMR